MAIRRSEIQADSDDSGPTRTSAPDPRQEFELRAQTQDSRQIQEDYDEAASEGEGFHTGALLPRDMTVRLVRAETANWETFLSVLYSATLTLFGIFLGAGVAKRSTQTPFSTLEWAATWAFLVLSVVLLFCWGAIKLRAQRNVLKIPHSLLDSVNSPEVRD